MSKISFDLESVLSLMNIALGIKRNGVAEAKVLFFGPKLLLGLLVPYQFSTCQVAYTAFALFPPASSFRHAMEMVIIARQATKN